MRNAGLVSNVPPHSKLPKKRVPIFQKIGDKEDGQKRPPIVKFPPVSNVSPNQIPSNSYTRTQNRNLAVSAASANTVQIDRVTPSLLKSGTESQDQRRNQIVSETNVPRLKSVNATTSRDVTTEHRWAFEISNTTLVNPADLPQNLQFAVDKNSHVLFLIDTGCEVSILPKQLTNGINQYFKPFSRVIQGIGESELHPIGSVNVELKLSNFEPIRHDFWVTQENRNYGILGLDFLKANEITIAPHESKLYNKTSNRTAQLFAAANLPTPVVARTNKGEVRDHSRYDSLEEECLALLSKYPQLTETPDYTQPPKHGHFLEIILDDYQPRMIKARRCNEVCKRQIDENFRDLTERGAVIRGEAHVCASPITVVPKKDGKLRICVDYTALNKKTRPLSYPLPRIDTLPEKIPGGTQFFSTLDLKEAYYSLPIHPDSQERAAIITTSGTFIPRRTTFGLRNAPTRFQQFMDHTFELCRDFTFIYLDDILIYSSSRSEHMAHVTKVLDTLSNNGLYINFEKCAFAKSHVKFLGHDIGVDGINVIKTKIEAVKNLPLPRTRRELKRFLGMVNYYHRHVPRIAEVMAPLNEISGGSKASNRAKLELNDAQIKAYHDTIATLAEATTLAYERHDKPLILFSDASDTHVGAVLEQEGDNGEMRPLAFFSKKLPPAKRVRSTFYKELRGVYLSLKHFQARVLGRNLIIRTDSKAVQRAITNELRDQCPHEQRWICAIKEYNPTVQHIEGRNNVVADSLSRPPTMAMYARVYREDPDYVFTSESDTSDSESDSDGDDDEEPLISPAIFCSDTSDTDIETISARTLNRGAIAVFQNNEPELLEQARSLKLTINYTVPEGMAYIVENGVKRVILPEPLRSTAYNAAHNRLHLGKDKSIEAIARTFWWPGLREDVSHWVNYCAVCQQTKVPRHNRPNIGFFPHNTQRYQFLHMDLLGPLDESMTFKYVLLVKDRATGFLVTAPLPDKSAMTVRNAFMQNWVGHYGVPQVVISDNGGEFRNDLLKEAFDQLGIEHRFTSARTPQTNGYVERQNRTINVAFRSLNDRTNWALHLPLITSNINNSFIEGSPYTPAQYAFGCSLNLSGRVLFNQINAKSQINRPSPFETAVFINSMADISRRFKKPNNASTYYQPGLFDCKYVWIKKPNRKKLDRLYQGPYKVVRDRSTEHSLYILKDSNVVKVSIRNVKAYVGPLNLIDEAAYYGYYNLRQRRPLNYAETNSSDE